ncbi:hypothetical protein A9Q85_04755 [Cycloclasticus sp. 44_32_T64]|nr:hypothetical protein A9Q85_04755 [Cycloclasticus sp. 44_32_T64]
MNNIVVLGTLAAIFILGLFLRFGVLAGTVVDTPVRADARKYVTYAYNLSHFDVYSGQRLGTSSLDSKPKPDAVITPGYPVYLSLFFDKEGPIMWDQLKSSLQVQTFLSGLCVIFIFYIFSPILGHWPSLGVALLTAMSPHLIVANVYLLTETLFLFLMVLWLFLLRVIKNGNSSMALVVLCGVFLAMASLTRSWIQYFIIFLGPFIFYVVRKEDRVKVVGGLVAGFVAVFLIWAIRNSISTGGGDDSLMLATLHHGMYPGMMYEMELKSFGFPYRFDPEAAFITQSMVNFFDVLWRRASEEPWRYFSWYLWGKASMVMSWDIIAGFGDVFIYPITKTPYQEAGVFRWTHSVMYYLHAPLTWMAVFGALMAWFPSKLKVVGNNVWLIRAISLLFIYFIAIHMVAAPFPRYSIPMRPVMYGLAIYFVADIWQRSKYVRCRVKRLTNR